VSRWYRNRHCGSVVADRNDSETQAKGSTFRNPEDLQEKILATSHSPMGSCGLHAPPLTGPLLRVTRNRSFDTHQKAGASRKSKLENSAEKWKSNQDISGPQSGCFLSPSSRSSPLCLFAYFGHAAVESREFRVGRQEKIECKMEEKQSMLVRVRLYSTPSNQGSLRSSAAVGRSAGFSCKHRSIKSSVAVASSSEISIFSSIKRALIGQ